MWQPHKRILHDGFPLGSCKEGDEEQYLFITEIKGRRSKRSTQKMSRWPRMLLMSYSKG